MTFKNAYVFTMTNLTFVENTVIIRIRRSPASGMWIRCLRADCTQANTAYDVM